MKGAIAFYQTLLKKYPFRTQVIQTGILMGTGDLLAQTTVERKTLPEIDFGRVARFGIIGTVVAGPALYSWYRTMDRFITGSNAYKVAFSKMAVDQLLFAPSFIIVLVGVVSYGQGLKTHQVVDKIEDTYFDILINNYKIWPMVQVCNFYLVPLNYRILVVQLVAIFWNTYLSWKMNKGEKSSMLL